MFNVQWSMRITANQYAKSLYELTTEKSQQEINAVIANFIKLLQKSRKMKLADKIIAKFSEIYNKENSIIEAEVATARELESSQAHKVESFLKGKYQAKEVVINNKVDSNIKGGIIIKVGDEILDASIERNLLELKKELSR